MIKSVISGLLLIAVIMTNNQLAHAKTNSGETIRMQLSWHHQFLFAGYYVAKERGYYDQLGLNVVLLEGDLGTRCDADTLRHVEFCNAPGSVVKLRAEGQPLVLIASILQHSPVALISKQSSGIATVQDLIGRRVEMLVRNQPAPELQVMLHNQGIKLNQLALYQNTVGIDALVNDEADAIFAYTTNEPHLLRKAGIPFNIIHPRRYGIDFYGDALLTSEQYLAENALKVARFREATLRGWRYAMRHPGEAVSIIQQNYPSNKSRELLMAEARSMEVLMQPDLIEIGHTNQERWWRNADALVLAGVIDADYTLEGFFYEPDSKEGYLNLIRLLVIGLTLMALVVTLFWLFNKRLSREIYERKKAQERLQKAKENSDRLAYVDELSGLGNRRAFYEQSLSALQLAKSNQSQVSLILLDIDHFKKINDRYGHLVGDEAIRSIGEIIVSMVRSNDIHGRIGGEEFAILLPGTGLQGAIELAERVRDAVRKTPVTLSPLTTMTASFGVTEFDPDTDDMNHLVQRADDALYTAKQSGRDRVEIR